MLENKLKIELAKEEYLLVLDKDTEIKLLLKSALIDVSNDRLVYMKGIDVSYNYEWYNTYSLEELDKEINM